MVAQPNNNHRSGALMAGIVFVPETAPGAGTGHVRRCIELYKRFAPDAALYLPPEVRPELLRSVTDEVGSDAVIQSTQGFSNFQAIVLDRPVLQRRDFTRWLRHSIVIGIDSGGGGRRYCSYTIDIIPRLRDNQQANLKSIGLLELPRTVRSTAVTQYTRALVTFGGEDPENLTPRMVSALLRSGEFDRQNITVVRGPLARWQTVADLRVLDRPSNLKDVLKEFDIVFTSFGLTAFEAAAAGAAVVLLNPTRYHARLGRRVGFPSIGVKTPRVMRLRAVLNDPQLARRCSQLIAGKPGADLAQTIGSVCAIRHWGCPVCRNTGNPAILRDSERTFYRCRSCGILYREAFNNSGMPRYDEHYFFDEYRRQYGKTYLEDYGSIRKAGLQRAQRMNRILKRHRKAANQRRTADLLDIGCAYGPFLDAARACDFRVSGLDVAAAAVHYVRYELRFPVILGSIEDQKTRDRWSPASLDAVTMWYVVEHIQDLRTVLRWIGTVVRPGGALALSTPNGAGISALKNRSGFLAHSPGDHVTVWTPRIARRVLRRHGFRVIRIVGTGHHPERFPGCAAVKPATALYRLLYGVSRVFRLGDTFEVYARRVLRDK
ncbi:MAG: methyltransferase domain-containing protein [Spirochaetaceae bacterium]|nr:MAG: methyltransferase domain-containing protein [Spirochaetaceae bacterium]